jgi:CBS domain-containing protein
MTLSEFMNEHMRLGYRNYFVVDAEERLVGIVKVTDLSPIPTSEYESILVKDVMRPDFPVLFPEMSVHRALEILLSEGLNRLPVVLPADPKKVIGTFDRGDAIKLMFLGQRQDSAQKGHEKIETDSSSSH